MVQKTAYSQPPPFELDNLISAVAHALVRKDRGVDAELLALAEIKLVEAGYDNWDGGTIIWEIVIELPYPEYLNLEVERKSDIESFVTEAIKPFLPEIGHWVHAKIVPSEYRDPHWRENIKTQVRRTPGTEEERIELAQSAHAFISYQTTEKQAAARIQQILAEVGVTAFLAHENIEVSAVWRERILEELGKATIFVSLLSERYFKSQWCVQESGIAAFRNITSIHLSLDGSIPRGFSGNVQSVRIDPETVSLTDLLPGIVASNFDFGINIITNRIGESRSYRVAEANFRLILPYLARMSSPQIKKLLQKCASNDQIHDAAQCASEYIPPLLKSHGHLLEEDTRAALMGCPVIARNLDKIA